MTTHSPTLNTRSRQQGIALIMAIILLIIATLTGLAGMRNTSLQEKLAAIEQRQKLDTQSTGARRDIKAALRKIVTGEKSDDFCGQLLESMTIYADGRVEVALKLLPSRWFFLLEGLQKFRAKIGEQQPSELPTEDMGGGDIAKFLDEQTGLQYCIFEKICFLQEKSSSGKALTGHFFSYLLQPHSRSLKITTAKPT